MSRTKASGSRSLDREGVGVLLDFDGTLYGDKELWTRTIQKTLDGFGITVTPGFAFQKARSMISDGTFFNISGVAIAIALESGVDEEKDVRARFLSNLDEEMDADGPGNELLPFLETMRYLRVGLGIVSFMRKPRLLNRLAKWNLGSYFGPLVTPEEFTEFKPAALPFLTAIDQLGVHASKCFVVGDEPVDMEGGRRVGARTVGVPRGFFSRDELVEAGAERIIQSLSELPEIVVSP